MKTNIFIGNKIGNYREILIKSYGKIFNDSPLLTEERSLLQSEIKL